jgi:hypothetical protein
MNRRSLATLAALIAVPAGLLTNAAVSSASPVAPAAHVQAISPAQLTHANAFAADSGGGPKGAECIEAYTYIGSTLAGTSDYWDYSAPPCPPPAPGGYCLYEVYQGSTLVSYTFEWQDSAPPCPPSP